MGAGNRTLVIMRIRVLGCSGGIGAGSRTTALLIDEDVLIDAGTGIGEHGESGDVVEVRMGQENMPDRAKVGQHEVADTGPGVDQYIIIDEHC